MPFEPFAVGLPDTPSGIRQVKPLRNTVYTAEQLLPHRLNPATGLWEPVGAPAPVPPPTSTDPQASLPALPPAVVPDQRADAADSYITNALASTGTGAGAYGPAASATMPNAATALSGLVKAMAANRSAPILSNDPMQDLSNTQGKSTTTNTNTPF